jgi:hypothetical protein
MKAKIAIAVAAAFATSVAFAEGAQPETTKAPVKAASQQVAQATGGGMATGAGEATGAVGTGLSATAIVAIGAGTALVIGASGTSSTTSH